MKVRTDFVTNSSSSSYVFFKVDSQELADILREYEPYFKKMQYSLDIEGDTVTSRGTNYTGDCPYPDRFGHFMDFFIEEMQERVHWHLDLDIEERQKYWEFINKLKSERYMLSDSLKNLTYERIDRW